MAELVREYGESGWQTAEGGGSLTNPVIEPLAIEPPEAGESQATATTALTGSNNDLQFTAKGGGSGGNYLSVEYADPGPSNTIYVYLTGSAITVVPSSDGSGNITSTAQDVADAIDDNLLTRPRLFGEPAPGNDGSGIVTIMAPLSLAGGVSALEITPGDEMLAPLTLRGYSESSRTPLLEALSETGAGVRVESDGAVTLAPSGSFSDAALTFGHPGSSYFWKFLAANGTNLALANSNGVFDLPALLLGGFPAQPDLVALAVFPNAGQVSDLVQLYQDDGTTFRVRIDKDGATTISPSNGATPFEVYDGANLVYSVTPKGGVIFPSADPHVAGAWWDNAGTLTRSAG